MDKFHSLFQSGGLSMDRLRNFCLVADAGGLSRAAGGDPGRMSLYSRQIKELETFFGVELTRRVGKTIAITEAGHRLARLARAHFSGLEEFQGECRKIPGKLTLGADQSVIEWLLMPRIGELRKALPNTVLELHGIRTQDVVSHLEDLTLDLGIIRTDTRTAALRGTPLFSVGYALFVPKALLGKIPADNLRAVLGAIPLATSMGGAFRGHLEEVAAKAKLSLRVELACSSFTQAVRAARTGGFGAVVPATAVGDFDPQKVVQIPLPFLKGYTQPLCLAWNPRLMDMRPVLERARVALETTLRRTFG